MGPLEAASQRPQIVSSDVSLERTQERAGFVHRSRHGWVPVFVFGIRSGVSVDAPRFEPVGAAGLDEWVVRSQVLLVVDARPKITPTPDLVEYGQRR